MMRKRIRKLQMYLKIGLKPFNDVGDLNRINGADGRVFKFLEAKLHLFILIPIKLPKIVRFVLNFHQNGDK